MDGIATAMAMQDLQVQYRQQNEILNDVYLRSADTAKDIAMAIYQHVIDFQAKLPDQEDVAMLMTTFGGVTTLLVDTIAYEGNSLIVFRGTDMIGKPLKLIQHASQLNFLLQVAPPAEQEQPKRKIGFQASDE